MCVCVCVWCGVCVGGGGWGNSSAAAAATRSSRCSSGAGGAPSPPLLTRVIGFASGAEVEQNDAVLPRARWVRAVVVDTAWTHPPTHPPTLTHTQTPPPPTHTLTTPVPHPATTATTTQGPHCATWSKQALRSSLQPYFSSPGRSSCGGLQWGGSPVGVGWLGGWIDGG